jgi:hypothetical protein
MNYILKQIKKIEMCIADNLSDATIVGVKGIANVNESFTKLNTVGLSQVETDEEFEDKEKVYTQTLTATLTEKFEINKNKYCFRVTTVDGERYIIGTGYKPYPIITFSGLFPNNADDKSGYTMSVNYKNRLPMLLQI